jgi:hypothetical protein
MSSTVPRRRYRWPLADLGDTAMPAPIPSLLRGFSAPVLLDAPLTAADRLVLLAHDSDPFNRWEAGRSLMRETLVARLGDGTDPDPALFDALDRVARDDSVDPAFRALALALPSEDDLAQAMVDAGLVPDPTAIHAARGSSPDRDGRGAAPHPHGALRQPRSRPRLQPRRDPGRRAIPAQHLPRPCCPAIEGPDRARAQYDAAGNMTDQLAAFTTLLDLGDPDIAQALLRPVAGRPPRDGQVVHGPGRPCRAGGRRRHRHPPHRASALRLEEPQPLPLRHRRADGGQPGGLPRSLPARATASSPTGSSGSTRRTRRRPRACPPPSRRANATTPTAWR